MPDNCVAVLRREPVRYLEDELRKHRVAHALRDDRLVIGGPKEQYIAILRAIEAAREHENSDTL